MTREVIVLHDPEGVLGQYLDRLRDDLRLRGARRVSHKGAWYWDLGSGKAGTPGLPGLITETADRRKRMTLAQAYVTKAEKRLRALETLLQVEAYSDVVREAQETVELALKGLLRQIGIDPPRQHDVGSLVVDYRGRLPDAVSGVADRLAAISRRLRRERELAFYGDDDFIPTEEYSREDAERALVEAEFVVTQAGVVVLPDC